MNKYCGTCIYYNISVEKCPCSSCNCEYVNWMGLTEWLNSFDTNSATKCFEAVNLLKEKFNDDK